MNGRGWSPATSTNYSFRLIENPDIIYISKSGRDKSKFSVDDFMEVDLNGNPTEKFHGTKSSAETLIHCAIYNVFPQVNCILHTHSIASVVLSALNEKYIDFEGYEILKGFEGNITHDTSKKCLIIENTQNMDELYEVLLKKLNQFEIPGFILRKHGTYAWGNNFFDAKRHLESLEYLLECELNIMKLKK